MPFDKQCKQGQRLRTQRDGVRCAGVVGSKQTARPEIKTKAFEWKAA
jgi:hypothetical protein